MNANAYTLEQMTDAVIETGLSFFYHDPHVQYDSNPMLTPMGWQIRRCDTRLTAEQCGPDNIVYTVCSDLVHRVYRDAAEFYLAPDSRKYWCIESTKTPADDPISVYKYDADDPNKVEYDVAVEECFNLLQPGDVLIYFVSTPNASGGHAMLYIGDYFGDGKKYILHSCAPYGGKFNINNGNDPTEPYGSIQLQTTDEICFHTKLKILGKRYIGLAKRFVLHRPLAIMVKDGYTLTPSARTRLQYKGLEFWKTLDRSQYSHVLNGETVTVTMTVTNHGKEAYENLVVTDPIPAGQTVVSAERDGKVADGKITWTLHVEPGEIAVLRYTVKVCGSVGDVVVFPAGTVGEIPTRTIPLKIGGFNLSEDQKAALLRVAQSVPDVKFRDLDTVNDFCRTVLGVDAKMPKTLQELTDALFESKRIDGADDDMLVLKENAVLPKNLLLKHIAGKYYFHGFDMNDRVLDYFERHYLPGDVFVCVDDAMKTVLQFYLGGGKVLTVSEDGAKVDSFAATIGKNLRMRLVLAFRPTMQ